MSVALSRRRLWRFAQFSAVGLSGMVVDLSVTFALLGRSHYLLANALGFILAATWNFGGNYWVTYGRPSGRLSWQYVSFIAVRSLTFALRAAVVIVGVEVMGASSSTATLIGVGVASVVNFAGAEWIFGRASFDLVAVLNAIAHRLYSSRVRRWLQTTGLYDLCFGAYARTLAWSLGQDRYEISIDSTTATFATKTPTETVSILHSLENERAVLEDVAATVRPDDVVVDVGSNLGVYSTVTGRVGADVLAIEPHAPTAERCRHNLQVNQVSGDVRQLALGEAAGTVGLNVSRDAAGTQRGTVAEDGGSIRCVRGDSLGVTPDVLKIDVEGQESAVLAGFGDTLSDVRVAYVEVHDATDDVAAQLAAAGMTVTTLSDGQEQILKAVDDAPRAETQTAVGRDQ
jgi:FkbM family methyltransferase